MIQLEKFVGGGGGWVVGWLTPTTYIQLAGAGSIHKSCQSSTYHHRGNTSSGSKLKTGPLKFLWVVFSNLIIFYYNFNINVSNHMEMKVSLIWCISLSVPTADLPNC